VTTLAGAVGIGLSGATGEVIGGGVPALPIRADFIPTLLEQISVQPSVADEPKQRLVLHQGDQVPPETSENDAHRPITLGLSYSVATAVMYAALLVLALILGALVL